MFKKGRKAFFIARRYLSTSISLLTIWFLCDFF